MLQRYKIKIEYDGSPFCGWQSQPNALTIQQVLEQALYKLSGKPISLYASGRTDAGVHATGQIAHFDLSNDFPMENIVKAINYYSKPHPIVVLDIERVPDTFHARFSAKSRTYIYKIINRPQRLCIDKKRAWHVPEKLDVDLMRKGASYMIGKHDLSSFRSIKCQSSTPIKTISKIIIEKDCDTILIYVTGASFLHNQVRIMMGNLRDIGNKTQPPEFIKTLIESRQRTLGAQTAPPEGLYLIDVKY